MVRCTRSKHPGIEYIGMARMRGKVAERIMDDAGVKLITRAIAVI